MTDSTPGQDPFWKRYRAAVQTGDLPDAHGGVSGSALVAVWRCFADHANKSTDEAYPSIERVALLTRLSFPTVQRAIRSLVSSGWLTMVSPQAGRRPPVYKVNILGYHDDNPNDNPTFKGYHDDKASDNSNDKATDNPNPRVITVESRVINEYPQGYHGDNQTIRSNREQEVVDSSVSPQQREETTDHQRLFKDRGGEESEAVHTRHHQEHTEQPSAIDRIRMLLEDEEQTHRGVWLVAQRIGRKLSEQDARSIAFTLQANTFDAEEMMQYLGEKIADHSETPDRLMVRYINADAPSWLLEARERSRVYLAPSYTKIRYTDEELAAFRREEEEAEAARERHAEELLASEKGQRYINEARAMLGDGMDVDDVLRAVTGGVK